MKACLIIAAAALLAWSGYHLASPQKEIAAKTQPPTASVTDPVEVFQRAFWKRPTPNDKILHAERREWLEGGGVKRWQWFIAVQPSPELVKHLRTDNAFNLAPANAAPKLEDTPDWFAFNPEAVDVMQAAGGQLRFIFSKADGIMYATDAGGGFRPGAPEPPKAAHAEVAAGRIPLTRPPNPPNP